MIQAAQITQLTLEGDRHLDSLITAASHGDTVAAGLVSAAHAGQDWVLHLTAAFGVWIIISLLVCYGGPIVREVWDGLARGEE